jgi:hypothetical protein
LQKAQQVKSNLFAIAKLRIKAKVFSTTKERSIKDDDYPDKKEIYSFMLALRKLYRVAIAK